MPVRHAFRHAACALALCSALYAAPALAETIFEHARSLYLGAQYEEALSALATLHGSTPDEQTQIAAYQVFCLIALGRNDEASRAIATMVAADPFYQPSETMASPRVRSVFREARRAALPSVVRREYESARAAFDRKDPASTALFERVLKLVADPDLDTAVATDLRVLADGFLQLSRTLTAPPAPVPVAPVSTAAASPQSSPGATPPAVASPSAAPSGAAQSAGSRSPAAAAAPPTVSAQASAPQPAPARTPADSAAPPSPAATGGRGAVAPALASEDAAHDGDPGVTPPVAISQLLPRWIPPSRGERRQEFVGILQLLIDAKGSVASATMVESVQPQYDVELLKTARTWRFKPAIKNGQPISYVKLMQVRLRPNTP